MLQHLSALGAVTLSADDVVHGLLLPDSVVYPQLRAAFGEDCVTPTGVNRAALARRVFREPEELRRLNAIIHPVVRSEIHERFRQHEAARVDISVVEIPLFVESDESFLQDVVVTVEVSAESGVNRAVARGMDAEDVRARMAQQARSEDRKAVSDWVIDAEVSHAELRDEVEKLWEWLQQRTREVQ